VNDPALLKREVKEFDLGRRWLRPEEEISSLRPTSTKSVGYLTTIGLEVHAQLKTAAVEMFCACPVEFGAEPNSPYLQSTSGCPNLPVMNEEALRLTQC